MAGFAFAAIAAIMAVWLGGGLTTQPPRYHHSTDEISHLRARLSQNASVYLPGSRGFTEATNRWQAWKSPSFGIIVHVATEKDVEQAIQYANGAGKPFLAISGGHGATEHLANVQDGVGIWMRGMNTVTVAPDGKSAIIGGGALSGEVVHEMWAKGKQTVTGACECTGAVAPMLGGGHGWLEGQFGLLADNLISARVTIANGTSITVSAIEYPDLFWALRGAGHNFGIVTSLEYKIYAHTAKNEKWAYHTMTFSQARLEGLYTAANDIIAGDDRPVELAHWSYWLRNPDLDPNNPIIVFYIIYQGDSVPTQYTTPFLALSPLTTDSGVTDLPGLANVTLLNMASPFCAHSNTTAFQRAPVSLDKYSVPALRTAFKKLASLPPPFNTSSFGLEAYSVRAVQQVSECSTAFADRSSNLLLTPFITYPSGNAAHDAQASAYGEEFQAILANASGKPLNAYLNYASGYERQEAVYGYENWRLERLRRLKRQWDPEGRFGYYVPVEFSGPHAGSGGKQ